MTTSPVSRATLSPPVWVDSATMDVCAPELFVAQFLPTYDVAVAHADDFRAPPARCYAGVMDLDLLQAPFVRAALSVRAVSHRVLGTWRAPGNGTAFDPPSPTFRLRDMVDQGWVLLAETPGVEMVLGQVSRSWKADASSTDAPSTAEQFTHFDEPGYAKIVTSLRVDPYGNDSSILTVETRVATTDAVSRRRFRRYWLLIGPASSLIRRMALRLLAALPPPSPGLSRACGCSRCPWDACRRRRNGCVSQKFVADDEIGRLRQETRGGACVTPPPAGSRRMRRAVLRIDLLSRQTPRVASRS